MNGLRQFLVHFRNEASTYRVLVLIPAHGHVVAQHVATRVVVRSRP